MVRIVRHGALGTALAQLDGCAVEDVRFLKSDKSCKSWLYATDGPSDDCRAAHEPFGPPRRGAAGCEGTAPEGRAGCGSAEEAAADGAAAAGADAAGCDSSIGSRARCDVASMSASRPSSSMTFVPFSFA